MVKIGKVRVCGSRRSSTVELWDMSDFLLTLTDFSWSPLALLFDVAIVCSFRSCRCPQCARHCAMCQQFPGHSTLHDWGTVLHEVRQTEAGLPAPHSPAEGRHWPPDLAGDGFLTPITAGHWTVSLPTVVRATRENSCQMIS